jgi:ribonuclease Z
MDDRVEEDLRPPCKPLDATLLMLGTASMRPSPTRNVSGNALRIGNEWAIVDCGEGTQHQIVNCPREEGGVRVSPGSISRIFITHLHGDHCFGLPGLLCLIDNNSHLTSDNSSELTKIVQIVGPQGLRNMIRAALISSATRFSFRIRIDELLKISGNDKSPLLTHYSSVFQVPSHPSEIPGRGVSAEVDGTWRIPSHPGGGQVASAWTLYAAPLVHSIESVGFVFHEHSHHGKVNPLLLPSINEQLLTKKNRAYQKNVCGIQNPLALIGSMQQGRTITVMENKRLRTLEPKDYISPGTYGRKIVILGDTCDSRKLAHLGANADILVHEATNAAIEENETEESVLTTAVSRGHSTPAMAGTFGRCCGAKKLVLTHFSSRYKGDDSPESTKVMNRIVQEAQKYLGHENVVAARDFMHMAIPINRSESSNVIANVTPEKAATDAATSADSFLERAGVV